MKKHTLLKAGAATAVIALTIGAPAFAQDADVTTDTTADSTEGQAIVVTGTRIQRPEAATATPVVAIRRRRMAMPHCWRARHFMIICTRRGHGRGSVAVARMSACRLGRWATAKSVT